MNSIPSIDHLSFWPFALVLSITALILYIRALNPGSWNLLFRSVFSPRAAIQLMREENVMENSFSGLLVFVFFLSFTLMLFNVQDYLGLGSFFSYSFLTYVLILFAIAAVYIVKVTSLYILQLIFEKREVFNEYVIVFMNINIGVGLLLLPLSLIYFYGIAISQSFILILSGVLFTGGLFLRYYRIFELGLRAKVKWHNIILYLCTLEILPVILIMTSLKNIGIIPNTGL